ncbi:unnamed protein product [Ectocarpus sp. CCAP 1310/34]|nr:unnamed protein product [Ectocarpus sp. CCAP 1310/34]
MECAPKLRDFTAPPSSVLLHHQFRRLLCAPPATTARQNSGHDPSAVPHSPPDLP